jgi:hypothetical protein
VVEDVTPYFFQGDVNRAKGFLIDDTAKSSDLGTPYPDRLDLI